ncbi:MAG: methyltransferase domain-containing protein [Ruminococcaceae bacterium]|nr:methyltransferase domain-containing protein [Oscillospiraceae bacterium]
MTDFILNEGERFDLVNEKLRLIQKKDGLTYGTDAYLLAAYIRASKKARAAELGSGTGIVSLLCAAREKLNKIYAIEIQEDFAELCKRNAKLNELEDKVVSVYADARTITPEMLGGEVDIVFSNPPYMKVDSGKRNEHDEKFIARHEVCGDIDDFCSSAAKILRYGGLFYCVYRPDRLSDLFSAMKKSRLEPKHMTFVSADKDTQPSIVLIEAKKGASTGLKITQNLLLHDVSDKNEKSRALTPEAEKIYENCSFDDFRKA